MPTNTDPRRRGVRARIARLYEVLHRWADSGWACPAAGTWAFLQSSLVPGPSEGLLIPFGLADARRALPLAGWTIAGSLVGAMVAYGIGALAFASVGQSVLHLLGVNAAELDHLRLLFATRGWLIVAAGSLPMLSSKATAIVAGALGYPFGAFLLVTVVVRGGRFLLVGLALHFAGDWVAATIGRGTR